MRPFVIWSFVIGAVALLAPPAVFLLQVGMIVLAAIASAALAAWAGVFSRAWYLYGRSALWLLMSVPLLLFWPGWLIALVVTCASSNNCL